MIIERSREEVTHLAASVYVHANSDIGAPPVVSVFQPTVMPPTALTVSEMVHDLREAGLPVSAIAEAARVERKTVYSWLDGTTDTREEHARRLKQVYQALLPAGPRDLRGLYRMWFTPLATGATLKALLAADHFDKAATSAAVKALWQKVNGGVPRHRLSGTVSGGSNGFIDGTEVTAEP